MRLRLPDLRVGRLDRDVVERRGAAAEVIDDYTEGRLDVLVGTSLVTKGLDVPETTLVGVVSADVALTSEIRFFGVQTGGGGAQAVVEISAKLVGSDGRIQAQRVFRAATPLPAVDGRAAAAALDQAMKQVLAEIVRWAGRG